MWHAEEVEERLVKLAMLLPHVRVLGGGQEGRVGECVDTVRLREMKTGISEASKRVSIFSFATQGGKQVSFYFRQRNWVQAREAQIRFPAG